MIIMQAYLIIVMLIQFYPNYYSYYYNVELGDCFQIL